MHSTAYYTPSGIILHEAYFWDIGWSLEEANREVLRALIMPSWQARCLIQLSHIHPAPFGVGAVPRVLLWRAFAESVFGGITAWCFYRKMNVVEYFRMRIHQLKQNHIAP